MCTARKARPEHMHGGEGQPQESKLAFCTQAATEARNRGMDWERFRHLVSVNMKTSAMKSAGGLQQLWCMLVSSVVEAAEVLKEQTVGNHGYTLCVLILVAPALVSCFQPYQLYLSLGGGKPK